MERRLLVVLALTALGIFGCSSKQSSEPAAAAPPEEAPAAPAPVHTASPPADTAAADAAPQEPTREGALFAGGLGFAGAGSGSSGSSASDNLGFSVRTGESIQPSASAIGFPTTISPTDDAAVVDARQQQELAHRARSEEIRRRVLEELQGASVLGALGSASGKNAEAAHPVAPTDIREQNPLQADALPPVPPEPAIPNPLRQTRREPRIPATAASPVPFPSAPPSDEIAPGRSLPVKEHSPAGGSSPPLDSSAFARLEIRARGADSSDPSGGSAPPVGAAPPVAAAPPVGAAPSVDAVPPLPPVAKLAKAEPPSASSDDESQFDVVEVMYGTDRQAAEQKASDFGHLLLQCLPTLVIGLLAACLIVVAARHRSWLFGTVATIGFTACVVLGYDAVDEVLSRIRGATKVGPRYTTDRSLNGQIELGRCEVTIPKSHSPGELEAPSILRLEVSEDISRHIVLQTTERLASSRFYDLLRQRVEQSARRELFVFVHGFNVSFEDAARRTAQIHYDLKFDGAPIFFSWPANDKFIFTYPADETNVAWSAPHLKQFLLEIVKESQAQSINLIAHSMGNRALAAALREIQLELHDQARLFNQVILAAPDIDADDFRNNIAPAMQHTARGLTLYASTHDEALLASQFLHRRPRAGDAGDGLTVIAGIDTIDVTAIDQSLWGHSYYGSSHPVLNDLRALLGSAIPPRDRTWLSPAERDGLTYWIFHPTRTATTESATTR